MAMYRNHRQPPKAWTAWLDGWTLDMQARGMSGQTVESCVLAICVPHCEQCFSAG